MPQHSLDETDLKILDQLQRNAKLTNVELASRVSLSPSPCLARVRALEKAGYISGYVALLDQFSLGFGVSVFIQIQLDKQVRRALDQFETAMSKHPAVMECYLMTGDSDYLIRVVVSDVQAVEKFIVEQLSKIPGVAHIRSSFALKQVKYQTALPLPHQLLAPRSG